MKAKPARKPGAVTLELSRRDDPLLAAAARANARSPFAIRNILVPVDFSDCSKKAVQYALPLARQHQAALTLLYVVAPAYGAGDYGGIDYYQLEAGMRQGGERELEKLSAELVGGEVPVRTTVRVGSPAREIVEAARSVPADLIVISTHGRTGLNHVFLGSVAEHVIQRAPCPVFVVREREHDILTG